MLRIISVLLVLVLGAVGAAAQTVSFYNPPAAVGSGLQAAEFIIRLSDSQHGGVFVGLASNDTTLVLVAPDDASTGGPTAANFVPNGSTDARFVIQGLENVTGAVTVTASAPGFTDANHVVDVAAPFFRIQGFPSTIDAPDPADNFYVQLGRLNAAGTGWGATEALRIGGPGATATFTLDDPLVGELVTQTASGQIVDLTMVGGQSGTPSQFFAGGVAFLPLAAGTTDVTVAVPGFSGLAGGVDQVTVDPADMSFNGMPATVGAGLRSSTLGVVLNGSDHGGTDVHLVSVDSSRVLLSASAGAVGQELSTCSSPTARPPSTSGPTAWRA